MRTFKVLDCVYGTHPSTSKFYELLLIQDQASAISYTVRRYGKAEAQRAGGTMRIDAGSNEFHKLNSSKRSGGYNLQKGSVGPGTAFGPGALVNSDTLNQKYAKCAGYSSFENIGGVVTNVPVPDPASIPYKPEPPKKIDIEGWGAW